MKLFRYFLMCSFMLLGLQNLALAHEEHKDAEIIATLNAINSQEIKDADLALQKNVNQKVNDFANMMKQDHSKSLSETKDLAQSINVTPVDTSKVKDLKEKGEKEYTKLSKLNGHDFAVHYAEAMEKGHKDALSFLNDAIDKTKNASLKDYLMKVRDTVKMHLEHAKTLEKEVKKSKA